MAQTEKPFATASETKTVPKSGIPKNRGNTPLLIEGSRASRIPNEHDVVFNGMIIGHSPDPEERARMLASRQSSTV